VQNVDAVSMLSDDFPKIASMYAGKKSQASAMEHTIRWQIKVKLQDKDPGLYQRFKDRLDSIISTYQGNWEQMIKELEQLKGDLDKGREKDERFASKEMQRPFYDCLKMLADKELSQDEDAKVVRATKSMCSEIRASLVVANFWEKPSEVKKLRDKIAFGVRLGLRGIVVDDHNAAEKVMNICKCSYGEILRRINEMA
jgi:type I restriction enzyme R subunit